MYLLLFFFFSILNFSAQVVQRLNMLNIMLSYSSKLRLIKQVGDGYDAKVINPQCACARGYSSQFVCLSVCLLSTSDFEDNRVVTFEMGINVITIAEDGHCEEKLHLCPPGGVVA